MLEGTKRYIADLQNNKNQPYHSLFSTNDHTLIYSANIVLSILFFSQPSYATPVNSCTATSPTSNTSVVCAGTSSTAIAGQSNASNVSITIESEASVSGSTNPMINGPNSGTGGWTIDNFGSIITSNGAAINLQKGGTITNENTGTIKGISRALISSGGTNDTLYNYGTITSGANSRTVAFTAGGTIINYSTGYIQNSPGSNSDIGVSITGGNATLTNSGSIISTRNVTTSYGVYIEGGSGTNQVTNHSGATISGGSVGIYALTNPLSVDNAGTISQIYNGNGIHLAAGGVVTNQSTGIITGGANGVFSGGDTSAVYNYGTIQHTSSNGRGVALSAGGSVTNYASGYISGATTSHIGVSIIGGNATLTNWGSIIATRYVAGSYGAYIEGGDGVNQVINHIGATITGGYSGVYGPSNALSIDNYGTISGTYDGYGVQLAAGGSITNENTGTISGPSRGVYASGSPVTVDNYYNISNLATGGYGIELTAGGTVTNRSTGTINGSFNARGVSISGASGTINNYGTISSTSRFTNANTYYGAYLGNGGNITNSGTIDGGDYTNHYGVYLTGGAGTLTNHAGGLITVGSNGLYSVNMAGGAETVYNYGTLTGKVALDANNPSSFYNYNGATVTGNLSNINHAYLDAHSTLSGTLTFTAANANTNVLQLISSDTTNASFNGLYINNNSSYTINNFQNLQINSSGSGIWTTTGTQTYSGGVNVMAGKLVNTGTLNGSGGTTISGATGYLDNQGIISASGDYGVNITGAGTLLNEATYEITGATSGVYVQNNDATITNAGTITGTSIAGIAFTNGGQVANEADGMIIGNTYGAYVAAGTGTITNAGTLNATANNNSTYGGYLAAGGTLNNQSTGTLSGYKGFYSNDGTITNAGMISGTGDYGVYFAQGGTLTNQVTGSIEGANRGFLAQGNSAILTNAGTISSSAAGTYGVELTVGGTVTNQLGATITGATRGLSIAGNVGSVSNAGIITGTDDYGVLLLSSGEVENTVDGIITGGKWGVQIGGVEGLLINNGQINGDVVFDTTSPSTLSNYGEIQGNILMGCGDDVVVLGDNSTITGMIDGGNGNNTLRLLGNAVTTYAGRYTNFQTLDLSGTTGPLTLSGTQNYDNGLSVTQGHLVVDGDLSGGIAFSHGGEVTTQSGRTVSAQNTAIAISGGTATIENSGNVTSTDAYAVHLLSGGTITNQAGAQMNGGERGVQVDGAPGVVTNLGTISGTDQYGVRLTVGGQVINQSTGRVSSAQRGISISGGSGEVNNAGVVTTTAPNSYAVLLSNGGSVTNQSGGTIEGGKWGIKISGVSGSVMNAGSITGDIEFDTSHDVTFSNQGTINGNVNLGPGDAVAEIWDPSMITGTLNGGGGKNNTLKFKGNSGTYDGRFTNFQKLKIDLPSSAVWNLTGTHTYTNGVDIEAGTLSINGLVQGSVNVGENATLKGNGAIDHIAMNVGSTLAPGNSIGTLSVNTAVFDPGTVFEVEVAPDGSSDLLEVNGLTTINGGTLSLIQYPGTYVGGTQYTVLTSDGGIDGRFEGFAQNNAETKWKLTYDQNRIYLTVVDFINYGTTPNEIMINNHLQQLPIDHALYGAYVDLTSAQSQALKQLSGEIHASVKSSLLSEIEQINAYWRHQQEEQTFTWFQTLGAHTGNERGDPEVSSLSHHGVYELIGMRHPINFASSISLMAGVGEHRVNLHEVDSQADVYSYYVGAMLSDRLPAMDIMIGNTTGFHHVNIQRHVNFEGFSNRLQTKYHHMHSQWFGEISFESLRPLDILPFLNISHNIFQTQSFEEKGGIAALSGSHRYEHFTSGLVGLRDRRSFRPGWESNVTIGWQQALGHITSKACLNFEGQSQMNIQGTPLVDNALVLEMGLTHHIFDVLAVNLNYHLKEGLHIKKNNIQLGVEMAF